MNIRICPDCNMAFIAPHKKSCIVCCHCGHALYGGTTEEGENPNRALILPEGKDRALRL